MTIHSTKDLAAAVRGRRKDMGMSQADLAEKSGVSRKWINDFETGKPSAHLGIVLRVIDELGLELQVLPSAGSKRQSGARVDLDALLDEHRGR